MSNRVALFLGALLAAIGVALGAYAAHGLEETLRGLKYEADLEQRIEWFQTGVRYHLYHALAIISAGIAFEAFAIERGQRLVTLLFLTGILLFSGSLYAMALGPESWRWLGAITPLGGLSLIGGWILLSFSAWKVPTAGRN